MLRTAVSSRRSLLSRITVAASPFRFSAFRCFETPSVVPPKYEPKSIEDDGYGRTRGDPSKNWWEFLKQIIQEPPPPGTLIIVRHGESEWNQKRLFTGWVDVDLSDRGQREIEHAARLLLERGYTADICYTSKLKRAIRSSWIILNELDQIYRPMVKTWRLNERMYGALEGHSKPGLAKVCGVEQVQSWRAGLNDRPPPMTEDHIYWHRNEIKYKDITSSKIPVSESLQDTLDRTVPFWDSHIFPDLKAGRNVLIVAHRNSIRGLVKHIDGINTEEIQKMSVPNGIPLVYKFDRNMKPLPHANAQKPLSGIWLEKKGLLRAAMQHEEELASRIAGYTPVVAANYNSKAYYKSSKTFYSSSSGSNNNSSNSTKNSLAKLEGGADIALNNLPSGLLDATLIAASYAFEGTMQAASKITRVVNQLVKPTPTDAATVLTNTRSSSVAASSVKGSGIVSSLSNALKVSEVDDTVQVTESNLIKSLTRLQAERQLLDLVDDKSKDSISVQRAQQFNDSYDSDAVAESSYLYAADIYVDPKVLGADNDAVFHFPHTHNMHVIEDGGGDAPADDLKARYAMQQQRDVASSAVAATAPSIPPQLDFNQLNNVHFFGDEYYHDAKTYRRQNPSKQRPLKSAKRQLPVFSNEATTEVQKSDNKPQSEATAAETASAVASATATDDVLQRPLLVIIRHGKTEHNKLGLFTGWEDASLAAEGRNEARFSGKLMKRHGIELDVVYTSWLSRAIETAWLVMNELDLLWLPVVKTWRLNERMYGALTGLSKKMIRQIYGEDQFMMWRRGFDCQPPVVSPFSNYYPGNDSRYVNYVEDVPVSLFETCIRSLAHGKFEVHRSFPKTESLKDCMERTIPYFLDVIKPKSIKPGHNVLIASSENAIRGLLMHLCYIHPSQINAVEIPTGLPLIYDSKQRRIRLLEEEMEGVPREEMPRMLLEKYNFGSCPQLLFKTKEASIIGESANCCDVDSSNSTATSNRAEREREIDFEQIMIKLSK